MRSEEEYGKAKKNIILVVVWVAYFILYFNLFPAHREIADMFGLVPILAAAWFLGKRKGFLGAVLISTFIVVMTVSFIDNFNGPYLVVGISSLLFIGASVGYLQDIRMQLIQEIEDRIKTEKEIHTKNKEIQLQKQYYESLANNNPVAVVTLDTNNLITGCNPAFLNLFGYQDEGIIGLDLDKLVVPENEIGFASDLASGEISDEFKRIVSKRKKKDGTLVDVEIFAVQVIVEGNRVGALGLYHDLTELNEAHKENLKLSKVVNQAVSPVMITNIKGEIEYVNIAFNQVTGYSNKDVIGKSPRILASGLMTTDYYKKFWETILSGKPFNSIVTNKRKNGELWYYDQTIMPLKNHHGEITHFVSTGNDITDKIKDAEALKKSEALYKAVMEDQLEYIYRWLPDGTRILANQSYATLLNRNIADLIGENSLDQEPEHQRKKILKKINKLSPESPSIRDDYLSTLPDGSQRWQQWTDHGIFNDDGDLVEIQSVGRDIHQLKLTEEDLVKAKQEAEFAAETKAEFLANMSHEIRTPLNAVVGMSSLLMDTKLDSEQQDYVKTIRTSSDVLLAVINDILDFSKIEAGKMDLEKHPFYLSDLVESSLDLFATRSAEKGLDLAYIIDDSVPKKLIGDVTRIRQILVNLLGNALKFTEKGEVVILVDLKTLRDKFYEIQFQVRDTGIGIPANRVDKLFKSFSQVDASTTRKYGGTGLGLAISKNLTELMGGNIRVESVEGKGTSFIFTIIAEASTMTARLDPINEQPELSGMKLLIVDDNSTNRLIIKKYTEKWGMKAIDVETGKKALEIIDAGEKFDLAVLDMQMPEMEGIALALEIHKREETKDLLLIMASSMGSNRSDPDFIKNFSAFLLKPIKPTQLFNVIKDVIQGIKVEPKKKKLTQEFTFDPEMGKKYPLHSLLVEDNAVNQKVASKLLEKYGYLPDIAANGLEAIQAMERQHYDVIFMDIQMPEMDGEEATKIIREKWPKDKQPWIVAMTAHSLEGDREHYMSSGMDDYISKPINVLELLRILERIPKNNH